MPARGGKPVCWVNNLPRCGFCGTEKSRGLCAIGAAVVFSDINFVYEVTPDPLITFGGEQQTIAIRSWTRGYRMFCIPKNIIWHKNKYYNKRSPFIFIFINFIIIFIKFRTLRKRS